MTPRPGLLRGSKIKNYKGSNALRVTWSPPPGFSSRELCVKWAIGDSIDKLKQIDKLRPVINKIIRKAGFHSFAFGVKPNETTVTTCLPPILD